MAFAQSDLDNINAAISSGELTVSYQGRTVTFRSLDDLMKAKREIVAELAATNGAVPTWPNGRRVASFSSGLDSQS